MRALALTTVLAVAAAAMAQSVSVTLTSSKAGQTVTPGTTIDWTISAQVTGSNFGLALFSTDLVQDAGNAKKFDIPFASSVPAAMTGFSRPAGISNPGEGGNTTGYVGVQRGTTDAKNLIQIGGAQNTFGQALTGIGQDTTVEGNVGLTSVIIAEGSFAAPAPDDTNPITLTYSVANVFANVLTAVNTAPNFSPVAAVTNINTSGGSFSFTVNPTGPTFCLGDTNCSGSVTFADIDPFVARLGCPSSNPTACNTGCAWQNADINQDGAVTFADIDPFVGKLGTTCP